MADTAARTGEMIAANGKISCRRRIGYEQHNAVKIKFTTTNMTNNRAPEMIS